MSSPFEFAVIEFALEHTIAAFTWLNKACQDRAFGLLTIHVDPRFDASKDDPRFASVTRQMGLASM